LLESKNKHKEEFLISDLGIGDLSEDKKITKSPNPQISNPKNRSNKKGCL
jgi:hypothetical protein